MKKKNNGISIMLSITLAIAVFLGFNYFTNKSKITNIKEVKYSEIVEKINNEESFYLYIGSKNCSHCQSFKPKVNEYMKSVNKHIYYIELSNETQEARQEIADFFDLVGTPTSFIIEDGRVIDSQAGDMDKNSIESFFSYFD